MSPNDKSVHSFEALVRAAAENPRALLGIARTLLARGERVRARELAACATVLAPLDPEILSLNAEIVSADIPGWHFSIVRDEIRNAAYNEALTRAIRPGMRVLDIGAGTGLLAMMAARAGAAEVVSCEMNPTIAAAAERIVAANGFSDRIRVIAKHSSDLDVEKDLSGRADLLVSEIVSNNMLSQSVLPVHEQAVRHLLKPGAQIIPARGIVRAALAKSDKWPERRMGLVDGFDLSPFNALSPHRISIPVGDDRLVLKSEAADLTDFDFQSGGPFPERRAQTTIEVSEDGANGIIQWISLDMDDHGRYENRPSPGATSCWALQFYPFPETMRPIAGERLNVFCAHDRWTLRIWASR